jgi:hypothetical protein
MREQAPTVAARAQSALACSGLDPAARILHEFLAEAQPRQSPRRPASITMPSLDPRTTVKVQGVAGEARSTSNWTPDSAFGSKAVLGEGQALVCFVRK